MAEILSSSISSGQQSNGMPVIAENQNPFIATANQLQNWLSVSTNASNALRVYKSGNLTFGVYAGSFYSSPTTIVTYAGSSANSVGTSTTTKIYLDSSGVLHSTTSAYPTGVLRLGTIVTTTAIQSITDDRVIPSINGAIALNTDDPEDIYLDTGDLPLTAPIMGTGEIDVDSINPKDAPYIQIGPAFSPSASARPNLDPATPQGLIYQDNDGKLYRNVSATGTASWVDMGSGGVSGYSGYSGVTGSNGTSGYSGYSGKSGYSGYSGTSGFSGYSGVSGTSGYSGYSGKSGYSGYSGSQASQTPWASNINASGYDLTNTGNIGGVSAEIVVNGTFATNLNGWTAGSWTQASGKAQLNVNGTSSMLQSLPTQTAGWFEYSFDVVIVDIGTLQFRIESSGPDICELDITTSGTYSGKVYAANAPIDVRFSGDTSIDYPNSFVKLDNVSLKKISQGSIYSATDIVANTVTGHRVNLNSDTSDSNKYITFRKPTEALLGDFYYDGGNVACNIPIVFNDGTVGGTTAIIYPNNGNCGMFEANGGSYTTQLISTGLANTGTRVVNTIDKHLEGSWGYTSYLNYDPIDGATLWVDDTCGNTVRVSQLTALGTLASVNNGDDTYTYSWDDVGGYTQQLQAMGGSFGGGSGVFANISGATTTPYDTTPNPGFNVSIRVQYVSTTDPRDIRYSNTIIIGT